MLSRDLLEIIAARCDACTRENLGEAVKMKFLPQKLARERLVNLYRPEIRYDARSLAYLAYFARSDHNFHVKITRYIGWTAYDYVFEKYVEDRLVYRFTYWTDSDQNIVVQHSTFCKSEGRECGCILCTKHLQQNKNHLIAEMIQPSHNWHLLKPLRCPRRFFSFKKDKRQLLKSIVF